MIRLQKILVPVDFSEFSRRAVGYACELANQFHSEVHVLHVVEPAPTVFAEGVAVLQESDDEISQAVERRLAGIPGSEWQELDVVRASQVGSAFVEIISYARNNDIDLIVLGTHGRGAVAHMLLGSVAEKVVRKAPCPVLTVRDPEHGFVMP